MCGIAGSTVADEASLAAMAARLRHRGPDGEAIWRDAASGLGFVHRRLAIIDLSPGGAQPRLSPDGRFAITYNGEIFNYRALRAEFEAAGERFASESDTEVLLRLLERGGIAALSRIVGMYAFALWDRERRELTLARDPFGIKPLVYAPLPGGGIAFASEIAALRPHPGVGLDLDREALSEYLACLYVPAPRTLYRGIRKLPSGTALVWRDGEIHGPHAHWTPRIAGGRAPALPEAVEELMPVLRRSVADHMVADVPVGCFLSGGIDSSVIAALMAEELKRQGAPPLRSFTMTFAEPAYDERTAAREVAAAIGSRHTELAATPRLAERAGAMIEHFGEPFGNPTALLIDDLSRKAREHVTVALVGDGGDEIFAGYPRYRGGLLARRWRRLPSALRKGIVAPLSGLIPESRRGRHWLRRAREFLAGANLPDPEMYAGWVEYFTPAERRNLLALSEPPESPIAALYRSVASRDPLDAMQEVDQRSFLPGNILAYGDAMSMAHALELRLPLLDPRLAEAVAGLSPSLRFANGPKTLLRAAAARLLPRAIVERPKRGFNPPLGLWLGGELASMVKEQLRPERLSRLGIEWRPVERLLAQQASGFRDNSLKIWALLMLDLWQERAR